MSGSYSQPSPAELTSPAAWALVEDKFSPFAKNLLANLIEFVFDECIPREHLYHAQLPETTALGRWKTVIPVMEELKEKAKARGLWNLFLSKASYKEGVALTNLEYAVMCEIMGRSPHLAPQATNCAAPDTGNMELLAKYASQEQKDKWLTPLMEGKIRSSFSMTEFGVASSDARNIRTHIRQEGDQIVINGHKWWISGAGDPRNRLHLLMGQSAPETGARSTSLHSIVIIPSDTPGVKIVRPMKVMGYDDAPEGHCEVIYDNVRVPLSNLVGGWGRGFEIIQGRLGPGRIHHCMRSIGTAARSLDLMVERVTDPKRRTFGKMLVEHGTVLSDIARSRAELESSRLLVLAAAHQIDKVGAKGAMKEIGIAKFTVPSMALQVVDRAMQAFGAEGISQDAPLAYFYAGLRTLRYADGPDEVHIQQIGKTESKRSQTELAPRNERIRQREAQFIKESGIEIKAKL
ncbi:acyl-dehydrogenase nm domain-like protein [Phaffia rhodozyma]|uniref:Acyl-dehydrogenase nm domain-like protein n=1 Tax=Phaffia rhodozyma TaxID=264483 RepID=A0A0F7SH53_PHARH|nr:acyl-dehydrogenase nm domain-like protein [Phaffia rhodozyma]